LARVVGVRGGSFVTARGLRSVAFGVSEVVVRFLTVHFVVAAAVAVAAPAGESLKV
jgi:hypothetical protein